MKLICVDDEPLVLELTKDMCNRLPQTESVCGFLNASDTIVYLMMHYDRDADGRGKPKTIGKMLDEKFNIEGACPIVIQSTILDGKHVFVTKGDGMNAAKAPIGMLPDVMDNDLKEVDAKIREYWGMAPLSTKSAKKVE